MSMNFLSLSSDLLILIFSYLKDFEVLNLNLISKELILIIKHESYWKRLLFLFYNIKEIKYPPGYLRDTPTPTTTPTTITITINDNNKEEENNSYYNCYKAWKVSFKGYNKNDICNIKLWWERFELWCNKYSPEILTTLNPPATELELNEIEIQLQRSIPSSLRLFYRFHNGQTIGYDNNKRDLSSIGWGIFGGTHYYDTFVNMRFIPLNLLLEITQLLQNRNLQDVLPHPKYLGTNPFIYSNNNTLINNNLFYEDDNYNGYLSCHHPHQPPNNNNNNNNNNSNNNNSNVSIENLLAFAISSSPIKKMYCLGSNQFNFRGENVYVNTKQFNFIPCHPVSDLISFNSTISINNNDVSQRIENFFQLWIEEYLRRLETGVYRFQPIDLTDPAIQLNPDLIKKHHKIKMISLIPLLPYYNPLPLNINIHNLPERRNYGATRHITSGVEIVACPTFIPEASDIQDRYSIRLTLLQNDPQRPLNLTKCQLISRHWNIYEPPTLDDIKMALDSNQPIPEGNYERIDGEAVVGLYPKLDINYSQPNTITTTTTSTITTSTTSPTTQLSDFNNNWPFAYQSCSYSASFPGRFSGHLTFTPGSNQSPTGPRFQAQLESFSFGIPDFIY